MHTNESITLTRDVEASVVPVSTKVRLQKGEQAYVTQSSDETRMPALERRERIAQGNTLGERPVCDEPCKGDTKSSDDLFGTKHTFCFALPGRVPFLFPQGVALGYLIPHRWG